MSQCDPWWEVLGTRMQDQMHSDPRFWDFYADSIPKDGFEGLSAGEQWTGSFEFFQAIRQLMPGGGSVSPETIDSIERDATERLDGEVIVTAEQASTALGASVRKIRRLACRHTNQTRELLISVGRTGGQNTAALYRLSDVRRCLASRERRI